MSKSVLWVIKERLAALEVISSEKDKAETKQQKEAWAMCWDLVDRPIDLGFDWAEKWSDRTEPSVFLHIENILGAEIAWLIYSSYLTDWDKNGNPSALVFPKFLIRNNQTVFGLASQAGESDEGRARYMEMNERLLSRRDEMFSKSNPGFRT